MVKAGHPQKACPHPSVCNLCWCFDLMSHWVFRQKLPGMAFLYFPHVLCFISTLYFFLFYFQSLALLCSFPFHSATVIDLYSFCFFSFCIFSLDLFDSSLFFPLTFTQLSNPHYSFGFFPLSTFHPSFLLPPTWPSHNPDIVSVQNFHSVFQPQLLSPPASATWFH